MSFTALTYSTGSLLTAAKMGQLQANTLATAQNRFKNLIVKNNTSSPSSKLDITIGSIATQNYIGTSLTVYADMALTGSGANADDGIGGLDTGSEAASTWYFVHLIYNPTLNRWKAMFSTSRTAPTLPSGYTDWTRIGAIYNSSSSNFVKICQVDYMVHYLAYNAADVIIGGSSTTFANVDCSSAVPPTITMALLNTWFVINHNTAGGIFSLTYRQTGVASGTDDIVQTVEVQVANVEIRAGKVVHWMQLDGSRTFDYKMSSAATTTTSVNSSVKGYYDPLN